LCPPYRDRFRSPGCEATARIACCSIEHRLFPAEVSKRSDRPGFFIALGTADAAPRLVLALARADGGPPRRLSLPDLVWA